MKNSVYFPLPRRFAHLPAATLALIVLLSATRADSSPVLRAVRDNDIGAVAVAIENAKPRDLVNDTTGNGVTPLHLAAVLNHSEIAELLISRGANLEARTGGGFSPLHWAARSDAVETARVLIAAGADVEARARKGITPLHWAANKNATNVVMLLLGAGVNANESTANGSSPMHWAMMAGSDNAGTILAFKIVSDEMEADLTNQPAPPQAVPEDEPPEEPPEEPVEVEESIARPELPVVPASPGQTLGVSLGLGEKLEFVWVVSLQMWVGKYEVTNGQYRRFRPSHDSRFREEFSLNRSDQPVVFVTWNDTREYCDWLNAAFYDRVPRGLKFRIPTEAEWVASAKCGDDRVYPWGNRWPPRYGNFSDLTARKRLVEWRGIRRYEDDSVVTCSVDKSGVNEWGIYGLAGNVWEWCEDWYDASHRYKVRHGGSWDFDEQPNLRIDARGFDRANARDDTVGFRLVLAAD